MISGEKIELIVLCEGGTAGSNAQKRGMYIVFYPVMLY